MKLTDLDNKNHAKEALKENFEVSFNVNSLNRIKTKTMLNKVSGLIKEAKQNNDFFKNQTSPTYMKLVFMEQALSAHYKDFLNKPRPRIVFENEEVEKSQVILAAQDMVDSVQKMIEDTSDMQVKELPALVSSIQSEIGVNESSDFNAQVTEALTSLSAALQAARATLESALGVVTGQGSTDAFASPDLGDMGQEDDMDMGVDTEVDADIDFEEPELPPVGGVGRARR